MDRTDEDRTWGHTLQNPGSGPRRRIRYQWCRLFGHRVAPMDVSWHERPAGSEQWEQKTLHRLATGCPRCRSYHPFVLTFSGNDTVYIDGISAVFT